MAAKQNNSTIFKQNTSFVLTMVTGGVIFCFLIALLSAKGYFGVKGNNLGSVIGVLLISFAGSIHHLFGSRTADGAKGKAPGYGEKGNRYLIVIASVTAIVMGWILLVSPSNLIIIGYVLFGGGALLMLLDFIFRRYIIKIERESLVVNMGPLVGIVKIPWEEIKKVRIAGTSVGEVVIHVDDPAKYLGMKKGISYLIMRMNMPILKSPIWINTNLAQPSADELVEAINSARQVYTKNGTVKQ